MSRGLSDTATLIPMAKWRSKIGVCAVITRPMLSGRATTVPLKRATGAAVPATKALGSAAPDRRVARRETVAGAT